MAGRRALHYVFKIGNRKDTIEFYTKVLGMKVIFLSSGVSFFVPNIHHNIK